MFSDFNKIYFYERNRNHESRESFSSDWPTTKSDVWNPTMGGSIPGPTDLCSPTCVHMLYLLFKAGVGLHVSMCHVEAAPTRPAQAAALKDSGISTHVLSVWAVSPVIPPCGSWSPWGGLPTCMGPSAHHVAMWPMWLMGPV